MSRTPAIFEQADVVRAVKAARATFKRSDVKRAWKAARAEGIEVVRTRIAPDGSIELVHKADAGQQPAPTPYDEWKAANGSR